MKGLVLKDIYCVRLTLILGLLLAILPNALLVLIGGGMGVEYIGTQLEVIAYIPYGIMNFVTVACFSSIMLNTLKDDVAAGWSKYQHTLPVDSGKIVLSKQIFTIVLLAVLVLCCYVANIFAIVTFGFNVEIMLMMPVVFALLCSLTLMPAFPLALCMSTKSASAIYTTSLVIMMVVLTVMMFIIGDNAISPAALRISLYAVLPVLSVAVTFLSYKASRKAMIKNLERE